MEYRLVGVEGEVVEGERGRVKVEELGVRRVLSGLLTCSKLAGDILLGFRVTPEKIIWCFASISQRGIGWKPSFIKAFRKRGLACNAAETMAEALIPENSDCLSSAVGTYCGKSCRGGFLHALVRGKLCGWD
jgi:hypothetical protein